MDFLIFTNNKSKYAEISRILNPIGINVLSLSDVGISIDVVEDGDTFYANALKKASEVCAVAKIPTISDDSGLCVEYLNGRPGVFTARYGGEDMNYPEKMQKLLDEMKNCPQNMRQASFISSIVCVFPNGDIVSAEESCDGYIGYSIKGSNGFGFDPIFYVGDKSYAEILNSEKDKISHRGKALRSFSAKLSAYLKKGE